MRRTAARLSEEIGATISDAELVVVPKADELVEMDMPERFTAPVRDFVAKHA